MKAIEAKGILPGLKSFEFVVSLVVYKKVMSMSSKLSDVLQKESLDLGSAASLIQATIREGASHSLCRDGTRFSVFGGFDTPETHIRHVQNLILLAEMESAS